MPPKNLAPKYSNVRKAVKSGYRRVSKSKLKELGYSTRSVLYTKEGVTNPTRFLTRTDIAKVVQPARDRELYKSFGFAEMKRERIKAARRKIFRHTHVIYSDYLKPITLEQAIALTEKFLAFLEKKYHPNWRNQLGIIYKGQDDDFSIMPRLWRDKDDLIIGQLKSMLKKYKAKMKIVFIIGWIEQSS